MGTTSSDMAWLASGQAQTEPERIVDVIRRNPGKADVLRASCSALAELPDGGRSEAALVAAVPLAVTALRRHHGDHVAVIALLKLLARIARTGEGSGSCVRAGAWALLLDGLTRRRGDVGIIDASFDALAALAQHTDQDERALETALFASVTTWEGAGPGNVVAALARHSATCPAFTRAACAVLARFSTNWALSAELARTEDAAAAATAALAQHVRDAHVARTTLVLLTELLYVRRGGGSDAPDPTVPRAAFLRADGVGALLAAMHAHASDADVLFRASTALEAIALGDHGRAALARARAAPVLLAMLRGRGPGASEPAVRFLVSSLQTALAAAAAADAEAAANPDTPSHADAGTGGAAAEAAAASSDAAASASVDPHSGAAASAATALPPMGDVVAAVLEVLAERPDGSWLVAEPCTRLLVSDEVAALRRSALAGTASAAATAADAAAGARGSGDADLGSAVLQALLRASLTHRGSAIVAANACFAAREATLPQVQPHGMRALLRCGTGSGSGGDSGGEGSEPGALAAAALSAALAAHGDAVFVPSLALEAMAALCCGGSAASSTGSSATSSASGTTGSGGDCGAAGHVDGGAAAAPSAGDGRDASTAELALMWQRALARAGAPAAVLAWLCQRVLDAGSLAAACIVLRCLAADSADGTGGSGGQAAASAGGIDEDAGAAAAAAAAGLPQLVDGAVAALVAVLAAHGTRHDVPAAACGSLSVLAAGSAGAPLLAHRLASEDAAVALAGVLSHEPCLEANALAVMHLMTAIAAASADGRAALAAAGVEERVAAVQRALRYSHAAQAAAVHLLLRLRGEIGEAGADEA